MAWTIFEITFATLLALLGGALKVLWNRTDLVLHKTGEIDKRVAVLGADKTNIFHRLDRIEEKLDRLLEK